MKSMFGLVLVLGLAAVGCGNNECEDAVDKLEECNIADSGDIDDDEASECNEDNECFSKCVNGSSCSEMKAFFEELTANDFAECLAKCQ